MEARGKHRPLAAVREAADSDPATVDATWRDYFRTLDDDAGAVKKSAEGASWKRPNWPVLANGDFTSALETYHDARAYCERHEMPLLVTQADYNIAYLHYLRGEYTKALELYRTAREHSERVGDAWKRAPRPSES